MNMPRLSILDLEQRIDPMIEYNKLYSFLNKEEFIDVGSGFNYRPKPFINHIDSIILTLPYTGSSDSFANYWRDRDIFLQPKDQKEATNSILLLISFYLTYYAYIEKNYSTTKQLNNNFLVKITNIIKCNLASLNYKITFEEKENQYGFKTPLIIKRDVDVDSVLSLIHNSDTRLDLLSYLDFRLENNLQEKQSILARLYKTIIDDGKEIYFSPSDTDDFRLKYQNELYQKIKQIYNQTDIRHGEKGKVELSADAKLKYCDMCFYLLLQLIRTPKSIEDMKEIKSTFGQRNR